MALKPNGTAGTIPAMVAQHVAAHGQETVLRKKDRGIWKAVTWSELGGQVRDVTAALQAIGFQPGEVACTLAETRPEWVYVDLGVLSAGGISGGMYPADEAQAIGEALRTSGCRVLFVESEEQLDKILTVRDACPALQRIVIFDMKGLRDFVDPMCVSYAQFIAQGADRVGTHGTLWETAVAAVKADQPAVLLFPGSGHTGKSRCLTHGDALHLIASARQLLNARQGDERLALLPMCQAMERVFGLYLALEVRAISNYLESPETEQENLQEVQPTLLGTDRIIWERLHNRISGAATAATRLQGALYRWAIAAGERGGLYAAVARLIVLRAVRRELGLARLRTAFIGGEVPSPEHERWAHALGIPIQSIDKQSSRGAAVDARYRALMEEAYGT